MNRKQRRARHSRIARQNNLPRGDVITRPDGSILVRGRTTIAYNGQQIERVSENDMNPTPESSAPEKRSSGESPASGKPVDLPEFLTCDEMCSLLRCSRATLDRQVKAGEVPGRFKFGGRVLFHRQTINAWICRNLSGQSSE